MQASGPQNPADTSAETADYEIILRPSRSMTATGKKAYYGGLAAAGALATYFAVKAGAWPVAVIVDIAFAAAAAGIVASGRSGQKYERVRITDKALEIYRFAPGQRGETFQTLPPFMLKVETICDEDGHCEKLLLQARGRKTEIGSFLPPDEKIEVAQELRNALKKTALPDHLRNNI